MKLLLPCFIVFNLLWLCSPVFSQSKVSVGPAPAWITNNIVDYSRTSLDKYASDGYVDFDYEAQYSLEDQTEYIRHSKKIISQAGVQNGSEISVSFNPSYQRLFFHNISIIRNGETINKLQLSKIKTTSQEKELTSFIYNGSLNAFLILEDVRPGDIIDFSYSRKGFNPVFKNKFSEQFSLSYSVPFYELYYKMIVPAGRKINIKNLHHTVEPVMSSLNGRQVYEWHKKDIPAIVEQDQTPSWFDPYPRVLVSEYNSWKELNDWALELFPLNKTLSPAVMGKIKEIQKACAGDGEKVQAVLRLVQDDIRYMGIEMGENSHKPADPSKVYAQRFGDCKEKSFLACCMLRAMNIEACPVLINTIDKKKTKEMLPDPLNFDHTTIRVKLDGSYYWYDPTIAFQRGDVKNIFYPDYQLGFVISDTTTSLTDIPFHNVSSLNVKDHFGVGSMSGSGTLTVTSIFKGQDADVVRDDFNNTSISELMTTYQKFYSIYYDDIKADSLNYQDDNVTGVFTTTEYYHIPTFWQNAKNHRKTFSFSAFSIYEILRRVKEKERSMPIGLAFPANIKESVTIDLPGEWPVTETEKHIKNDCYAYNYRFFNTSNIVHLEADYKNLKNYVTVEEAPVFFKDLDASVDFAAFEISNDDGEVTAAPSSSSGKSNLPGLIAIGVIAGGIALWNKWKRAS